MRLCSLRPITALLVTAALAACGGTTMYVVSGSITGLADPGLVLSDGTDTVSPKVGDTTFTFPTQIGYGTAFNIAAQNQPAHQTCNVLGGNSSAGETATIAAVVVCATNTYLLSGTVTGLPAGASVSLGTGSLVAPVTVTANGAFQFVYPAGQDFTIAPVQTSGTSCTVSPNGIGNMGDAAVSGIVVTCQ